MWSTGVRVGLTANTERLQSLRAHTGQHRGHKPSTVSWLGSEHSGFDPSFNKSLHLGRIVGSKSFLYISALRN